MLQLLCAYRFKACRYGGCVLMQQRKYKSCNGVFLKSIAACAGHGYRQETADACARFKKTLHLQAVGRKCLVYLCRHCVNQELRRIERCQYR